MNSMAKAFRVLYIYSSLLSIPGMLTWIDRNSPLFQSGWETWLGICFVLCSRKTGWVLSSCLDWWTKLLLLSRPLVGLFSLLFMGWSLRRLNFAAWARTFVSFLYSRDWSPVTSSILLIGVDLMAPVMSLSAWFWILQTFSKFDFDAVAQAEIPYSATGLTLPM